MVYKSRTVFNIFIFTTDNKKSQFGQPAGDAHYFVSILRTERMVKIESIDE